MDIGGDKTQLLIKLMTATSMRDRWISNNIANQSVPGYKRRDVHFEELLRDKLAHQDPNLLAVKPEVVVDTKSPAGADGNNVVLEVETTNSHENKLMFELYATIFQSRMGLIESAIRESR
ncbi:MAG: flagellar basal body rod protein FlgB [Planctomycetes bacterium]|nr:flagellar basal body rod protein FlgB [Planctomycetota bacterium]